jgi:hypothetical protein
MKNSSEVDNSRREKLDAERGKEFAEPVTKKRKSKKQAP